VHDVIERFHARDLPPDRAARVEAFVRSAVLAAEPRAPFVAENHLTVVTQIVAWADRIGLELDPGVVFHPETIDRFLLDGCAHLSDGSRLNYRTILWRVGAAVLGPHLFPAKPLPLGRTSMTAPYSDADIIDLVSSSRGLPTPHMRRNARALLAIGFGAGLRSEEIQRLVGTDIRQVGDRVVVDVPGERARQVPVFSVWADDVWAFALESGPRPYFCPERGRITRRDVIGFIERCSVDDKAAFNTQRLRVTWMVHHLSAGTHLLLLTEWAGVGARHLVKYLKYATLPTDESHPGNCHRRLAAVTDNQGES
jgi:hypothetical protein